jgi:hypothetical protein
MKRACLHRWMRILGVEPVPWVRGLDFQIRVRPEKWRRKDEKV